MNRGWRESADRCMFPPGAELSAFLGLGSVKLLKLTVSFTSFFSLSRDLLLTLQAVCSMPKDLQIQVVMRNELTSEYTIERVAKILGESGCAYKPTGRECLVTCPGVVGMPDHMWYNFVIACLTLKLPS